MLTRSKIKMEESFKQIHQNHATYAHQDHANYYESIKQLHSNNQQALHPTQEARYTTYKTSFTEDSKPHAGRNDILKELRQEYEILRNLSVDENEISTMKQHKHQQAHYESPSEDLSSSMASKSSKNHRIKESKLNNRQVQALHLEKKQLELVIGNSMRKIQELLNNQITLKKTIHELRTQIEGKGGVSMEYQKTIRTLQKNEEEVQSQYSRLKHENDKNLQRISQLQDKVRSLEAELDSKDRELKQGFDEQRRFHELIRIEKDKYLNLEIQCRSLKMELEMLEKEKNNEINRLIRDFETRDGSGQRDLAWKIQKLEEEVREKDKRYHELLVEKERRGVRQSEVVPLDKNNNKSYLEELLQKSRSMNENNNKAISDGMALIFAKMSELERKNEENLKKEVEGIKRKVETNQRKKSYAEGDKEKELYDRVVELESIIERVTSEKHKLSEEVNRIEIHKVELLEENEKCSNRIRQLEQREAELLQEITDVENLRDNYNSTVHEYNTLKAEHERFIEKLNERGQDRSRVDDKVGFREKEKRYEEEIRVLKRRVDEAEFQAEKSRKEGEFNINMYKTTQDSEIKRLIAENNRLSIRCREAEDRIAQLERQLDTKVKSKESELSQTRITIDSITNKAQDDLISQKKQYEERITTIESRHTQELKIINEKFMSLTVANEKMISQMGHYGMMESQLGELRRLLRAGRNMNASVDHLWSVKQAEYDNIMEIIRSVSV